jgi:hypothetical protein
VGIPPAILVGSMSLLELEDSWALPLYGMIVATWGVVGAFLATRRPSNAVGWLLWLVGVAMGLALLGQVWASVSFVRFDGSLPGTTMAALLGILFEPALYLIVLVPIIFPDGRPASRRWALVGAAVVLGSLLSLLGRLLKPGDLGSNPIDNPLGVPALADLASAMIELAGAMVFIGLPAGVIAAIVRYRRGTTIERQQLKWVGWAFGVGLTMIIAATLLPQPYGQAAWILASLSISLVPIAIGIAILRYRLYEIDRLVSRTVSWGLVTGCSVAVFALAVLALQSALSGVTQGKTVAVAASTLIAAALFEPLRSQVQRAVDRRFDRARYDAQRGMDAFAAALRDEVDLARIERETVAYARATVRPVHAAIWLRGGIGVAR